MGRSSAYGKLCAYGLNVLGSRFGAGVESTWCLTCSWAACSLLAPSCVGLASTFELLNLIGGVAGGMSGPSGGSHGSGGEVGGAYDGGGVKIS